MGRWFGTLGAALGAVGVALGAFGAHALKDTLAAHGTTAAWETATLYHLVHAVALVVVALVQRGGGTGRALQVAGWGFAIGIVLFSGSLYLLALKTATFLGPITPLGGTAFIVAWIALALALRPRG